MKKPNPKALAREVDDWNSRASIGTPVNYRNDAGKVTATITRSKAQILSGHSAVVWLEGVSGCIHLSRVTVRTDVFPELISIGDKYSPAMTSATRPKPTPISSVALPIRSHIGTSPAPRPRKSSAPTSAITPGITTRRPGRASSSYSIARIRYSAALPTSDRRRRRNAWLPA